MSFTLITTKLNHSFNQSAITTIPLYSKSWYIKKKSQEKQKNIFSLLSHKTEGFIHGDNIKHLPLFFEKKSLDKCPPINSIAFQYLKEPITSCNMKQLVHLTKSNNKKKALFRRFFFTLICLFVILLAVTLAILLIVRFS